LPLARDHHRRVDVLSKLNDGGPNWAPRKADFMTASNSRVMPRVDMIPVTNGAKPWARTVRSAARRSAGPRPGDASCGFGRPNCQVWDVACVGRDRLFRVLQEYATLAIPYVHYNFDSSNLSYTTNTNVWTNYCPITLSQYNNYAVLWSPGNVTISINATPVWSTTINPTGSSPLLRRSDRPDAGAGRVRQRFQSVDDSVAREHVDRFRTRLEVNGATPDPLSPGSTLPR
jgi:hypothetical protein